MRCLMLPFRHERVGKWDAVVEVCESSECAHKLTLATFDAEFSVCYMKSLDNMQQIAAVAKHATAVKSLVSLSLAVVRK
jgi:hypothetical protein